ncbi:MAG: lamin tail domain-containing protein [Candidatus Chisholmbacteria bacterium]|nr:lamin tail domain-containing protein [Candidatus Chisholmbacteria bacterium]
MKWWFILGIAVYLIKAPVVWAQVNINEFEVDPNPEWVEFYNPEGDADVLKSYWLDDDLDFENDSGSSSKKSLAGLNTADPMYPYLEFNSFLNNSGDYVVLFDAAGNLVDHYQYTQNPGTGISMGRSPDGEGEFTVLATATKGSANSAAKPSVSPTPSPTASPEPELTPVSTPTSVVTTTKAAALPTRSPAILAAKTEATGTAVKVSEINLATTTASGEVMSTPEATIASRSKLPWGIMLILGGATLGGMGLLPVIRKWYHKNLWSKTGSSIGGDRSSFGQE